MSERRTFVERTLAGEVLDPVAEIRDEVHAWHRAPTELSVYEWLGLTRAEYGLWVERPKALRTILAARHQKADVFELLRTTNGSAKLAARGGTPAELASLQQWLRATGRL